MSEVERYWIDPSRLVQEGWHQDDTCVVKDWAYDRVVVERDAALVDLSEIKESMAYRGSLLCRIEAQRDALQQRLTAADERVDVLEGLLRKTLAYFTEPGMPEDLLAEFKAALAKATNSCTWQYGAFSWRTSCGQEWMLNDGTPEQNGMKFCHSCGKTLVVDEDQPESERES